MGGPRPGTIRAVRLNVVREPNLRSPGSLLNHDHLSQQCRSQPPKRGTYRIVGGIFGEFLAALFSA